MSAQDVDSVEPLWDDDEAPTGEGIPGTAAESSPAAGASRPGQPATIEETGLSESFLCELLMKHLYFGGEAESIGLAGKLKVHYQIVATLLETLKKQESVMALGGTWSLGGAGIRHAITDRGRARVDEILRRDSYCGPAPVPFEQYVAQLKLQSMRGHHITPERVTECFSRLVLDPSILNRIGPAINSGRSIFLYGPPGNGKTSMAECITETIGGEVFVPHAIILQSEIIRVFDPIYHRPLETTFEHDLRWVYTRRPVVVVGGELTMDMLDLTWTREATYYEAPFQVKAESGVLFIDDFGRQRCDPRELLNRWIVPLESGYDFLTFKSGQKAQIPFDNLIVFSTNLDPRDLVDEAFLRRIRYKIKVDDPTEEGFRRILRTMCEKCDMAYSEGAADHLIEQHYRKAGRPFRSCQPRDLIEQMVDICKYSGEMPALTPETIDRLCNVYFVPLE